MLRNFATIAPATACATSASSNTTNGAFPPSSIEVRSTRSAAWASSRRPTGMEPVKLNLRNRGSANSGPDSPPGSVVVTTLTTPGGSPSSASNAVNRRVDNGVASAGLITTGHPAASAGPSLRVAMAKGKFQGVIK